MPVLTHDYAHFSQVAGARAAPDAAAAAAAAYPPSSAGPALPAGVTLRQIDGGPSYYADNGFTYAASPGATMLANGAVSWDDPAFFPIGNDYCFYSSHSTAVFKDLGLNFVHRVTGGTDLTLLRNAGIWALLGSGDSGCTNIGQETFGVHVEEPSNWADITAQVGTFDSWGLFPGRLIQASFTWNQLVYGFSPAMTAVFSDTITTSAGPVHLSIPGDDIYWFASSLDPTGQYMGGLTMTGNGTATAAQMQRGTNYGDMTDMLRVWNGGNDPVGSVYIENENDLTGSSPAHTITPPELNWAVWSTIVHGARWVIYFGTTGADAATFGFPQTIAGGQDVSLYDQAKATNTLVTDLARIINAPFALDYATVTPAAYVFPAAMAAGGQASAAWSTTGIDICAKYYTGGAFTNAAGTFGDGFYIFTTYRGNESASGIGATFTLAGGYSGTVTAINADGGGTSYGGTYTLTASGGVFTDTFTSGSSVRIYRVGG